MQVRFAYLTPGISISGAAIEQAVRRTAHSLPPPRSGPMPCPRSRCGQVHRWRRTAKLV
jgi:hypothetical protein